MRKLVATTLLLGGFLSASPGSAGAQVPDQRIAKLMASVSPERLKANVEKLAGFETRNLLSTTTSSTRGIGAARNWILQEMKGYSPRLQVSFDTYQVAAAGRIAKDTEIRNVVAVLPGRSARRIYVGGHYDSFAVLEDNRQNSWGPDQDRLAPGANDDASGTALTMELARVFAQSGVEFDATLVFIAFAGEEQGLIGAALHAERAVKERWTIDAVYNNDMIGNSTGGNGVVDSWTVRVFSEGPEDSSSRQLARHIQRFAARYVPSHHVRLIAREDRFGRGGDHTPFNQQGFAAVRLSESKENYGRQHTIRDTPDGVNPAYLAQNARVNAASMATAALAPPSPNVLSERGQPMLGRGTTGYDAHLRWQPSPGATGYRIFWREAWGPDWQHEMEVGNVTEAILSNLSIDDYIFGVAAIGPGGHESLVSAYIRPPRARVEVRTVTAAR